MADIFDHLERTGVGLHGPFHIYRVTYNHYIVPDLEVHPIGDGTYNVIHKNIITHRPVTVEELENWVPIIANAMAHAAGYSCHGEGSVKINPYDRRLVGVTLHTSPAPPPNLTIVKSDTTPT